MKRLLAIVAMTSASCATAPQSPAEYTRVSVSDLALEPEKWDGRKVEVAELLIWEFENLGLWGTYEQYCSGYSVIRPIYVDWEDWPGVTRADNRRYVLVRGTFRNRVGVKQSDGQILVSTGAPGPGPLEPGIVVRWLSDPLPPCR